MRTRCKALRGGLIAAVMVGSTLAGAPEATASTRAVQELSRYCTACWHNARLNPDCWPDCTQEVLTRLLERVSPQAWGRILAEKTEERREFFRAIDAVKKRMQRSMRTVPLAYEPADTRQLRQVPLQEQHQTVLDLVRQHLSPRQAQVVRLTLDGWTVREIAEWLGLSPPQVSDEKYKAIRKLRGLA